MMLPLNSNIVIGLPVAVLDPRPKNRATRRHRIFGKGGKRLREWGLR